VGDGSYRTTIETWLQSNETLRALIELQPWSDTIEALQASDVVLIPSRFEGVPLVMLEAMAVGVPVIASDLPGTQPYLGDDSRFPVGDLARAFDLVLALRDETHRRDVIARNRAAFNARASGEVFANSVRRLTQELLEIAARARQ
jgi:glycosyltransferase involved in cell wall biosynthesis